MSKSPSKQYQELMSILNTASEDSMQKTASEEKVAELEKFAEYGEAFADGFIDKVNPILEKKFEEIMVKTAAAFIRKLSAEFMAGPVQATQIAGVPGPSTPGAQDSVLPKQPYLPHVTSAEVENDANATPGITSKATAAPFHGVDYLVPQGATNESEATTEAKIDELIEQLSDEELQELLGVDGNLPVSTKTAQDRMAKKIESMGKSEFSSFVKKASAEDIKTLMSLPKTRQAVKNLLK